MRSDILASRKAVRRIFPEESHRERDNENRRTLAVYSDISKANTSSTSEQNIGTSSQNRGRNVEVRGGRC